MKCWGIAVQVLHAVSLTRIAGAHQALSPTESCCQHQAHSRAVGSGCSMALGWFSFFWEMDPDCGVVPMMVNGKLKYMDLKCLWYSANMFFFHLFFIFSTLNSPSPLFFKSKAQFSQWESISFEIKPNISHHIQSSLSHARAVCVSGC